MAGHNMVYTEQKAHLSDSKRPKSTRLRSPQTWMDDYQLTKNLCHVVKLIQDHG